MLRLAPELETWFASAFNQLISRESPCCAARSSRRFREMQENGADTTLEEITAQIEARDKRDSEREDSPLKPAPEAYVLDTTLMKKEEAIAAAIRAVERAVS